MTKAQRLYTLARDIAAASRDFQRIRGPGEGDHHTAEFMAALRLSAVHEFGQGIAEHALFGATGFKADFYFADEGTIVEVALGLPNPNTEFEKDVLKAIIARDLGHRVDRLVFISRAGAEAKCSQAGRMAVRRLVEAKHGIAVEVHDLPGEPRVRRRRRAAASTA